MKTGSDSTLFRVRKFDLKTVLAIVTVVFPMGVGTWLVSCGREAAFVTVKPGVEQIAHDTAEALTKKVYAHQDESISKVLDRLDDIQAAIEFFAGEKKVQQFDSIQRSESHGAFRHKRKYW